MPLPRSAAICGMWPKPGTQGCDGLLRVPLAQDNAIPKRSARGWRRRCGVGSSRSRRSATRSRPGTTTYNQSWVPQLRGLLAAPLQEVGIELVVENFAVGNMGEYPWTAGCLNHRLGDRLARAVDLVTWNWALYDDAPCARGALPRRGSRRCPGGPSSCSCRTTMSRSTRCRGERVRRAQAALGSRLLGRGRANLARERIFLGEAYVPGDAEAALLAEINAGGGRGARKSGAGGAAACASEGGTPAATQLAAAAAALGMRRRVRSWLPRAPASPRPQVASGEATSRRRGGRREERP